MKLRNYILPFFICLASIAQGQDVNKAAQLIQEGKSAEAIVILDKAITDAALSKQAKTWYYRGFAYKDVFKTSLDTNHYNNAVNSLVECIKLDTDNSYSEDCKKIIKYLANEIYNRAIPYFNSQNYLEAYNSFNRYIKTIQKIDPTLMESKLYFNTGYCAFRMEMLESAKYYFEKAREMNHPDPLLYQFLGEEYWKLGDRQKSIEILDEGTEKFPHYKDIVILEIKYLLALGEVNKTTEKLSRAINLDPTNNELRIMLALLYEQKSKTDRENKKTHIENARNTYLQILEREPNHLRANYNIALSYYNEGVNLMNDMDESDDDLFSLMDIQDVCIDLFKKALPYMEKANELNPENKDALIGLSGIYFSLNMIDKANQIKDKITALEKDKK